MLAQVLGASHLQVGLLGQLPPSPLGPPSVLGPTRLRRHVISRHRLQLPLPLCVVGAATPACQWLCRRVSYSRARCLRIATEGERLSVAASARRHRRRVSPAAATDMLRTQRVAAANLTIAFLAGAAAYAVPAPPVARTRHVDASSGTDTSPAAPTLMDVPASTIRRAVNRARKRARSTAGLGEGRSLSPARRAVPRRPRPETIPSVMAQGHVTALPAPSASPAAAAPPYAQWRSRKAVRRRFFRWERRRQPSRRVARWLASSGTTGRGQ